MIFLQTWPPTQAFLADALKHGGIHQREQELSKNISKHCKKKSVTSKRKHLVTEKKKKKVIYNIRDTKLRSFKVTLKIYLVHFLASDHRQLLEKSQYYLNLPYLKVFSSYSELSHREVVEVMRHSRWRKKNKHHKQKRKKSKQQK